MKLNITQIVSKLRSGESCHINKSDLQTDMEVIREVNRKSVMDGTNSNPKLKSYYESGNTDIIEFSRLFMTTLLAQDVDVVIDNNIATLTLK